jgi:hypothetical protein
MTVSLSLSWHDGRVRLLDVLEWLTEKRYTQVDYTIGGLTFWAVLAWHVPWWELAVVTGGAVWAALFLNSFLRCTAADMRAVRTPMDDDPGQAR